MPTNRRTKLLSRKYPEKKKHQPKQQSKAKRMFNAFSFWLRLIKLNDILLPNNKHRNKQLQSILWESIYKYNHPSA